MGAEIGNSTQKLHARGPIGLRELCTFKYWSRATATSAPERRTGVRALGILGGTFNPPHIGHLVCAQEALDQLGLDRVRADARAPRRRTRRSRDDPGAEHRVELCRLAVAGDERLDVSTLEVDARRPVVHGRYPEGAA